MDLNQLYFEHQVLLMRADRSDLPGERIGHERGAALIAWKWYHAFHRVDRRRRLRDNEIYEERLAQREADEFADRPDPGESEPGRAP